jgi:hypothetical protein
MLYQVHLGAEFKLTALVGIGIDCIGSYKSNYNAITTTTVPRAKPKIYKRFEYQYKNVIFCSFYREAKRYTNLSVACDRLVVFSRYSGFSLPIKLTTPISLKYRSEWR